jgi:hypothetical protein
MHDAPRMGSADWRLTAGSLRASDRARGRNDDLIDILAAVLAIVVITVIAFAF